MQRDRELAEFEIDPTTGKARVIDIANDDLVASAGLARQNRDRVLTALIERRALSTLRSWGMAFQLLTSFGTALLDRPSAGKT